MSDRMSGCAVALSPSRAYLWVLLALILVLLPALWATSPAAMVLLPWLLWRALVADGWLQADRRVRGLELSADGRCHLWQAGRRRATRLRDDSVVWPWLTLVNLDLDGRRVSVAVFPDSASGDDRRRLRVFLRWPVGPAIV